MALETRYCKYSASYFHLDKLNELHDKFVMNTIIWVIKADITSVLWFCKDTFEYFLFSSCPLNEHFDVNEQLLKSGIWFWNRSLSNFRD